MSVRDISGNSGDMQVIGYDYIFKSWKVFCSSHLAKDEFNSGNVMTRFFKCLLIVNRKF